MPQPLLLDFKLPKVDGLEVLRRVRGDERTRLLPAVILTSSEEQEDLIVGGGCGLGAISFLRKPVDATQLRAAIGQLDTYWMVSNASKVGSGGGVPTYGGWAAPMRAGDTG